MTPPRPKLSSSAELLSFSRPNFSQIPSAARPKISVIRTQNRSSNTTTSPRATKPLLTKMSTGSPEGRSNQQPIRTQTQNVIHQHSTATQLNSHIELDIVEAIQSGITPKNSDFNGFRSLGHAIHGRHGIDRPGRGRLRRRIEGDDAKPSADSTSGEVASLGGLIVLWVGHAFLAPLILRLGKHWILQWAHVRIMNYRQSSAAGLNFSAVALVNDDLPGVHHLGPLGPWIS